MPKIGERVKLYPRPGHRVDVDPAILGRFFAPDGEEVTFSYFHHERLTDGSLSLEPFARPEPAKQPAKKE